MRKLSQTTIQRYLNSGRYEYINIGSVPCDEPATQAGTNYEDGVIECKALANQLIRLYGAVPEACFFFLEDNYHEAGVYTELNVMYQLPPEEDMDDPELHPDLVVAEEFAFNCENLPDTWDEAALDELQSLGHSKYQPAKVIPLKRTA